MGTHLGCKHSIHPQSKGPTPSKYSPRPDHEHPATAGPPAAQQCIHQSHRLQQQDQAEHLGRHEENCERAIGVPGQEAAICDGVLLVNATEVECHSQEECGEQCEKCGPADEGSSVVGWCWDGEGAVDSDLQQILFFTWSCRR